VPNDTADLTVFFVNLGSRCVKAVRRTMMKLSPEFLGKLTKLKFRLP